MERVLGEMKKDERNNLKSRFQVAALVVSSNTVHVVVVGCLFGSLS
jgi:F0F1-type ATP synthase assembly protein I